MKKIISLILALVMVMGLATTAFAASIDVQNVLDGETYTAYKILNYTHNDDNDDAYSYYLTATEYASIGSTLESAGFKFDASSDGTEYFVTNAEGFDAGAAAEYLAENVEDLGSAIATATATGANGTATFENLPTGYYFVTSTTGSLCALHSDEDIATAVEKNTVPSVDKTQTLGTTYADADIDANIGDTVHYKIVITDGTGTDKTITMTDTMTAGITYTADSLKINGTAVADDADTANWKVTVSGQTITIVFAADYVGSLDANSTITVTYDATVNSAAVVDNATGNENEVKIEYSEQEDSDEVYVATYDFQLYKTDGSAYLPGAGFKLYDADGNQIKVSEDNTGYYVNPNATEEDNKEIMVDSANGVNVRGLAHGTYYLEETTVPAGYNKLAERQAVIIQTGATSAVVAKVVNNAGSVLPTTGGIGTTLFYVIGGLLMTGAVVLLVTKKRMA